jgi:zinc/manganese transport system permease protein
VHFIIESGFFSSQPVRVALTIGGIVAVVSAAVGIFTVMRGQSFAGHTLTDVSTAGGSAAFLLGMNPLLGFIGLSVVGSATMDLIGVQRARGRDLATGIVLGASIGLAALFLYLDSTTKATTGATQQILFGSIFTLDPGEVPIVCAFSAISLVVVAVIYRPLLLATMSPDIAAARGVRIRVVGLAFMLTLAVAVGLSSLAIGSILSTALLIGPAAAALRLTKRIGTALITAMAIGVAATWIGVLLAYDSYDWGSSHNGYPVSFFIVAVTFLIYLGSGLRGRRAGTAAPTKKR